MHGDALAPAGQEQLDHVLADPRLDILSDMAGERHLRVLSAYLDHVHIADTQWYLEGSPELMGEAAPPRKSLGGPVMTRTTSLAPVRERFFVQRLMQQRQASPHTSPPIATPSGSS